MTDTDPAAASAIASAPLNQVDVVTVNWNAGDQLATCISSVRIHDERVVRRFIVVDNGSRDGSADIDTDWPKLRVDKVEANLGFGRACNRGAAQSDAPFVLFLNPDTRLTEPAISNAVAFLQSDEGQTYGACGIKLIDETGKATRHCARFPSFATFAGGAIGLNKVMPRIVPPLLMEDFDHLASRRVDHVQGAFYLVRREVFSLVGGFDEDYFVYLEDLDLSLKINHAGYGIFYLAETAAFHRGGGTSGQVKGIARFYATEARLLYARKHFGSVRRRAHVLVTYLLEPIAAAAWYLGKHRGRGLGSVAEGLTLLIRHMPATLRGASGRARGELAAGQARSASE